MEPVTQDLVLENVAHGVLKVGLHLTHVTGVTQGHRCHSLTDATS